MPFFSASTVSVLSNRIRRQPLAVAGVLLLAAFVVGGLAAPWIAPANPAAIELLHRLESPSAAHWAGTDELGCDTLSRLLFGARLSLAVSVTLGASGMRIFFRHILPNIVQPILVQAAIGMAGVILAETTLSFLGLGIPAPAPSWGAMLNDARLHLFDSPHMVLFPALAVDGAVLASTSSAMLCATSSTCGRSWNWGCK